MRRLLVLLALALPSFAQTFAGHCEGQNATSTGETTRSTGTCTSVPANAFFVCFVSQDDNTTAPTGVTDGNSAAMTHVTQADSSIDTSDLATVWWIKTTGFTGTATVTWAANHTFDSLACRWYTGQDLASPIDVNNITASTLSASATTLVSSTFTTANANETILICTRNAGTTQTFSVGLIGGTNGGNLQGDAAAGNQMSACEDLTVTSIQTSITGQLNWTPGAAAELSGITIKKAAAAGGTVSVTKNKKLTTLTPE